MKLSIEKDKGVKSSVKSKQLEISYQTTSKSRFNKMESKHFSIPRRHLTMSGCFFREY